MMNQAGFFVLSAAFSMAVAVTVWAHEYSSGHLVIAHPHMTAPLPGANISAGYLTITNRGSETERLIAVSADFAKKGQIHSVAIVNGTAKMRPVTNGIEIPPGQSVVLKKGGFHMMFLQVSQDVRVGKLQTVSLMFEKASRIDVEMIVVKPVDIDDEPEAQDHTGH